MPLLQPYLEGVRLYRAGDFSAAADQFRAALQVRSGDGPSRVYVQRCERLAQDPPDIETWDGVYVMQHK
jgi:adenylate cyclase